MPSRTRSMSLAASSASRVLSSTAVATSAALVISPELGLTRPFDKPHRAARQLADRSTSERHDGVGSPRCQDAAQRRRRS